MSTHLFAILCGILCVITLIAANYRQRELMCLYLVQCFKIDTIMEL